MQSPSVKPPAPPTAAATAASPQAAQRTPHRPPPPVTSKRLGALGNTEDKAQTARNNALGAKTIETGDGIVSLHDSNLINVASKIAQLRAKLDSNLAAQADCEDGYKWSLPCGWDFATLIDRFGFQLTVPEIAALVALGEYNPADPRFALQELASTELSRGRLGLKRDDFKQTNKHADAPVGDVTITLYEFLHADVLGHAREELSRTDAGLQRLLKSIEYHRASKQECLAVTDTQGAEEHHRGMVDDYVEILEIMNSRLGQLALTANDTSSFRGQAQAALAEAHEVYTTFNRGATRLQDMVTADLVKSEQTRVAQQKAHKDGCAAHELYVKSTQQTLRENASKQLALFDQIQQIANQMKALAEERLALLQESCDEKRTEELRVSNYNEFTMVHADHLAHLQKLKDLADNYCLTSGGLLEYHQTMSSKIAAKDVEGQLAMLTIEEAQRYLEHYRGLIFGAGELSTAKELRVETLQRQRRLAQLQRETAVDLYDPDAHSYLPKQAALSDKMIECQQAVTALREVMDRATRDFEPAQDILYRHGIEFEHPVARRTELAALEKQRYVDRTLDYVTTEESAVETHKEHLRKLKHLAESEHQQAKAARMRSTPRRAEQRPAQQDAADPSPVAGAAAQDDNGPADDHRPQQRDAEASPEAQQPAEVGSSAP